MMWILWSILTLLSLNAFLYGIDKKHLYVAINYFVFMVIFLYLLLEGVGAGV